MSGIFTGYRMLGSFSSIVRGGHYCITDISHLENVGIGTLCNSNIFVIEVVPLVALATVTFSRSDADFNSCSDVEVKNPQNPPSGPFLNF